MRHGRPNVPRNPFFMKREQFNTFLTAYDEAGLSSSECDRLRKVYQDYPKPHLVISSDLPRALETAHLFARSSNIIVDPIFREVPVWVPDHQTLFLNQSWPAELWWSYLRYHWLRDQKPEGRTLSVKRAHRALEIVKEYQRDNASLALVSHAGFLMVLINLLQQERAIRGRRLPHISFGLPTTYTWKKP